MPRHWSSKSGGSGPAAVYVMLDTLMHRVRRISLECNIVTKMTFRIFKEILSKHLEDGLVVW